MSLTAKSDRIEYELRQVSKELNVCRTELENYISSNNLTLLPNGNISGQTAQLIFDFYVRQDNRPAFKLHKNTNSTEEFDFETKGKKICISRKDVLSFLSDIPDESVDLIVTDPAYSGMNQMLKLGRGKIIGKYSEKGDGQKWFDEFHDTEQNYNIFLKECYRILKKDRHIYIMFDSFSLLSLAPLIRKVFDVKNIIVWDKLNIGLGHYFRRRHEFIVFASKGKRPINSKSFPDIWRIKRITQSKYPTQKPVEIFEMMIAASAENDFTVADPFLGSGSSAIASIKRNCNFIGCDISLASIQASANRIRNFINSGSDVLQPVSLVEDDSTRRALDNGKLKQK